MIRAILKTVIVMIVSAFLTIGLVVFFIWTKNPYNVRNCVLGNYFASKIKQTDETKSPQSTSSSQTAFKFSDQQKSALDKAGLNTESLPIQLFLSKEDCFKQKIGEERVKEIKAGSVPTPLEIFKSKDCL